MLTGEEAEAGRQEGDKGLHNHIQATINPQQHPPLCPTKFLVPEVPGSTMQSDTKPHQFNMWREQTGQLTPTTNTLSSFQTKEGVSHPCSATFYMEQDAPFQEVNVVFGP